MASSISDRVNAMQVGNYFVETYYRFLKHNPDFLHPFYSEASTMMRCDGAAIDAATGIQQIHDLIMSLKFSVIEIRTVHSLQSSIGGVLVMVSGLMQTKDYGARRKFVQTFFLAPREKGYFVLNDIFHFVEEEQLHQHPVPMLARSNVETKLSASNPMPEPVSDYMVREEIHARDFVPSVHVKKIDTVDNYSIPEPKQKLSGCYERMVETTAEESTASCTSTINTVRDQPPVPAEEPVGEPPKETYASILRIGKGQSGPSMPHPASLNKNTPVASEWHHVPQSTPQQSLSNLCLGLEKCSLEAVEEVVVHEDEGDAKSVYVGNLPSSITTSDLEQEFRNFGRIRPDGVNIRSRKETGFFYAFIEFEDAIGVQNALKASPLQLNGRLIHVEGRRPNSGTSRGRRGRGRGWYPSEAPRGRFGGRTFGRGSSGEDNDRDYNSRSRGNGYLQRSLHPERGVLGN